MATIGCTLTRVMSYPYVLSQAPDKLTKLALYVIPVFSSAAVVTVVPLQCDLFERHPYQFPSKFLLSSSLP